VAANRQFVEPAVSKAKFDRQVLAVRALEQELGRRGCWLVSHRFPVVFMLFGTPKLKPPSIVFGAIIDFSNYDIWPPSVRLVDPFTREPYIFSKLPTHLNRAPLNAASGERTIQPLMQASSPNEIPFLCIPGVREYHNHPGHTGDSWLMHRGSPEGTLFFIIEQLLKYGVEPISAYDLALKINISGYNQQTVPE
jgi:hypothetical protein